ncbi:transmembrane protein, putative [Medicago truncatula]|uniref:Transmembrane protein, putative n=1 Tax=Medicago truncatula TaxID=3880 RepID=G7I5X7_MEDTR|nr:transmembrane protein, putative [Medicago truncatula]
MSHFANWHPLYWCKFALSRCKVVHQSLLLMTCLVLPLLSLLLGMREKTNLTRASFPLHLLLP